MKVKIERLGKVSFAVRCRNHSLLSDQPVGNGGNDLGLTPPELLLASLGACIGYYIAQFCELRNMKCDELEISLEGEYGHHPARIQTIGVDVNMPASVESVVKKSNHGLHGFRTP